VEELGSESLVVREDDCGAIDLISFAMVKVLPEPVTPRST